MRIVVLGTRGFPDVPGGVEKHCEELYPRLARLGCDVTVITRTPYISPENRHNEWAGIKFRHLWAPRTKSMEAFTHTLLGVIISRKLSPDIIHIHASGPALFAPFAKSMGYKVVMTHHGPEYKRAKWGKLAKYVIRRGEKYGVKYSDNVVTISGAFKEYLTNKYNRTPYVIPNGVSIPDMGSNGGNISKWGVEPSRYAFTACRFVPEKGLLELINAYNMIRNPKFKLVVAGDADHESDYSRNIKYLAANNRNIVMTGYVVGKDLKELYRNAGLFVLPSFYEGMPLALLEALSYGIPVLVSDIEPHKYIKLHQRRYFSVGNVHELSVAMTANFNAGISSDEKDEYIEMIKREYNWDVIAKKTLEVYEDTMK